MTDSARRQSAIRAPVANPWAVLQERGVVEFYGVTTPEVVDVRRVGPALRVIRNRPAPWTRTRAGDDLERIAPDDWIRRGKRRRCRRRRETTLAGSTGSDGGDGGGVGVDGAGGGVGVGIGVDGSLHADTSATIRTATGHQVPVDP